MDFAHAGPRGAEVLELKRLIVWNIDYTVRVIVSTASPHESAPLLSYKPLVGERVRTAISCLVNIQLSDCALRPATTWHGGTAPPSCA